MRLGGAAAALAALLLLLLLPLLQLSTREACGQTLNAAYAGGYSYGTPASTVLAGVFRPKLPPAAAGSSANATWQTNLNGGGRRAASPPWSALDGAFTGMGIPAHLNDAAVFAQPQPGAAAAWAVGSGDYALAGDAPAQLDAARLRVGGGASGGGGHLHVGVAFEQRGIQRNGALMGADWSGFGGRFSIDTAAGHIFGLLLRGDDGVLPASADGPSVPLGSAADAQESDKCFRNLTQTLGVYVEWPFGFQQTPVLHVATSSDVAGGVSFVDPAVPLPWAWNDTDAHHFSLSYSRLTSPLPTLVVTIDGAHAATVNVDLEMEVFQGATPHAHLGLFGCIASQGASQLIVGERAGLPLQELRSDYTEAVHAWPLTVPEPGSPTNRTLFISCPFRGVQPTANRTRVFVVHTAGDTEHELDVGMAHLINHHYAVELDATSFDAAGDWTPDGVVGLRLPLANTEGTAATATGGRINDLEGCYIELYSAAFGYRLPSPEGSWQCHGAPIGGWTSPLYDLAANGFVAADQEVGQGNTPAAWAAGPLVTDGYPFIPNIALGTRRIWPNISDTPSITTEFSCRFTVPRYCHAGLGDLTHCTPANAACTGSPGICTCTPYYRDPATCLTDRIPILRSVNPTSVLEDGGRPAIRILAEPGSLVVAPNGNASATAIECRFGYENATAPGQQGVVINASDPGEGMPGDAWVDCVAPARSPALIPERATTVTLTNAPGKPVAAAPLPFTFVPLFTVDGSSPTFGTTAGGDTINITGTGFQQGANLECSIGPSMRVPATWLSSTSISCVTLANGPGVFTIRVSIVGDASGYAPVSPDAFTIEDPNASPFCRGYRGAALLQREFPFVGEGTASAGGAAGFVAQNVLASAVERGELGLNLSPAPGIEYNVSELVDADFCCQARPGNLGLLCGALWNNVGPSPETQVEISFPRDVLVNEAVVAWSQLCTNMPAAYELWGSAAATPTPSGPWFPIFRRETGGVTACDGFAGDSGAVALCVDYFTDSAAPRGLTRVRHVSLRFNNTVDPATNRDGSHLYEVALQGAWADQAWVLGTSSTWWANGVIDPDGGGGAATPPQVRAPATRNGTTLLPDLELVARTLDYTAGTAVTHPDAYAIARGRTSPTVSLASACRLNDDQSACAADLLASGVFSSAPQPFATAFQSLELDAADSVAGTYVLQFVGEELPQPLEVRFDLLAGAASAARATAPGAAQLSVPGTNAGEPFLAAFRTADAEVELGPIELCATDGAGNAALVAAGQSAARAEAVDDVRTQLAGDVMVVASGAEPEPGCLTLSSLRLVAPAVGSHGVRLSINVTSATGPMTTTTLETLLLVDVLVGPPSAITLTAPSEAINGQPVVPAVRAAVTDAAGNAVRLFSAAAAAAFDGSEAEVVSVDPDTLLSLNGTTATFSGGEAVFSDLLLVGDYGPTVYTLSITVPGFPVATVQLPMASCGATVPGAVADPTQGSRCLCAAGYEPTASSSSSSQLAQCTPCPAGTFTAQPGLAPCETCPAGRTTAQPAATECVCDDGTLVNATTGACEPCPAGAVCLQGALAGTADGWWYLPDGDAAAAAASGSNTTSANATAAVLSGAFLPCHLSSTESALPHRADLASAAAACPAVLLLSSSSSSAVPAAADEASPCGEGYAGARCLSCRNASYGRDGASCVKCADVDASAYTAVIFLVLAVAVALFMTVQGSEPARKEAVTLRVLWNHVQVLGLVALARVDWPDPFRGLSRATGALALLPVPWAATECWWRSVVGGSDSDVYGARLAVGLLSPFVALVALALLMILALVVTLVIFPAVARREVHRSSVVRGFRNAFAVVASVVAHFSFPAVAVWVFSAVDCRRVEDDTGSDDGGATFLTASATVRCFHSPQGAHATWVILAVIVGVLFLVVYPLVSAVLSVRLRLRAAGLSAGASVTGVSTAAEGESGSLARSLLSIPAGGYRRERMFWESLVMLRKVAIVIVLVVFRSNALFQMYGATFVIQAALLAHIVLRPFVSGRQQRLELWSLLALLATAAVAVSVSESQGVPEWQDARVAARAVEDADDDAKRHTAAAYVAAVALVLLHAAFLLAVAFFVWRGVMRRSCEGAWRSIHGLWAGAAPAKLQRSRPKKPQLLSFFAAFAASDDYGRQVWYSNLAKWWQAQPSYSRRRLYVTLRDIALDTPFAEFVHLDPNLFYDDDGRPDHSGDSGDGTNDYATDRGGDLSPPGGSAYNTRTSNYDTAGSAGGGRLTRGASAYNTRAKGGDQASQMFADNFDHDYSYDTAAGRATAGGGGRNKKSRGVADESDSDTTDTSSSSSSSDDAVAAAALPPPLDGGSSSSSSDDSSDSVAAVALVTADQALAAFDATGDLAALEAALDDMKAAGASAGDVDAVEEAIAEAQLG